MGRTRRSSIQRHARPSATVYRAIADPTRRAILDGLVCGPRNVNDIAADFAMSRPAISKHLRLLRRAALVSERRAGRLRMYQLNPRPLREVDQWLERPGLRRLVAVRHH